MLPDPWTALVIALAAYRLTRLIGWDDLPPIQRLRQKATGESVRFNATESRGPIYAYRHPTLAHFLGCAYCLGFWVCLFAYGVWLAYPQQMLYASMPLALSGAVGVIARMLDP